MIKLGLIGFGGMGELHANCYKKMENAVEVTAVADLRPERRDKAVELLGATVYETAQELLDNAALDAVDICLPTFLHAEYAIKAMEKGLAVMVEKPVCLNGDEGEKMLEAQKRTGAKVEVGHVIRFWDEYIWLKNTRESGIYGKLLSATFTRISCNPRWSWENWFNDCDRSGTVALDLHIHDADFIRYMMGEPQEVMAMASRNENGVIDGLAALYRYGDVVICAESVWNCMENFPFRMNFRANFEKATIVYEESKLTVYPAEGEPFTPAMGEAVVGDIIGDELNVSGGDAYYNELRYFIECISKDKEIEVAPLCESVKSVELVEKEIELMGGKRI